MAVPGSNSNALDNAFGPGGENTSLTLANDYTGNGAIISGVQDNFTVEMWVKPESTHQVDAESQSGVEGLWGQKYAIFPPSVGDASQNVAGMGISLGTNGISVYEHNSGYLPPLLVWAGTISGWTHIAIVYENKQPRLYVNGVLLHTGLTSLKGHIFVSNHLGGGDGNGYYPVGAMDGKIDEVRVWSYVRSQQQIAEGMNGTVDAQSTGLAAYWPINETEGNVVQDITGHGYNVSLNANYSNGSLSFDAPALSSYKNLYRYGFNGQEHSTEIGDDYTAEFWEYDSRISRRWNIDPKPISSISPYSTFLGNPIFFKDALGDSSLFNYKGDVIHYDKNDKDLRVFMQDKKGKLSEIGKLGGNINVDEIMKNLLEYSRSQMVNNSTPRLTWFSFVLPGEYYDLKADKKRIFGVAWAFDATNENKPNTSFSFNYNNGTLNLQFSHAADVGNFHAGYTGIYAGVPISLQKAFAGGGEKVKNVVDLDWRNFFKNPLNRRPYGDRPPDYFWNTMGMSAADYDKKINATILPPPIYPTLASPRSDNTNVRTYNKLLLLHNLKNN